MARVSARLGDCFRRGALQELVDQRLVGFVLLCREAAQLRQQPRGNANRDELLGIARLGSSYRPSHAPRPSELLIGCFRDVAQVEPAIRQMPCAPCGSRTDDADRFLAIFAYSKVT